MIWKRVSNDSDLVNGRFQNGCRVNDGGAGHDWIHHDGPDAQ